MQVEIKDFAKLIKKCAFEMNVFDKAEIEKCEEEGRIYYGGVTTKPTFKGQEICEGVSKGMGLESLGYIVYLLLAYAWNDALDWADTNGAGPG